MKLIGKLLSALFRLLWLPFKIVIGLVSLAFRVTTKLGLMPFKVGRALGRLSNKVFGVRGMIFGLIGFVVGLLVAPVPGRQLREKLMVLLAGGGNIPDDELADKVSFELSHAPRTWNIDPQPEVSVLAGRVELSGQVRTPDESDELGRVAAAVPGVMGVENRLQVAESSSN